MHKLDRGTHLPTRELKQHIAILKAWLRAIEVGARRVVRPGERVQAQMRRRLGLYEMELALRDARREWSCRPASRAQLSKLGARFRVAQAV
jgi:hypothetical protein